jgi:methylphosphotriester-DNA--protein-cysteine methyltransferase
MALNTGFQSLGPFNRAFKAETGMTPSQYRMRERKRQHDSSILYQEIGESILIFGSSYFETGERRLWLFRLFHRRHHRSHNPSLFTA